MRDPQSPRARKHDTTFFRNSKGAEAGSAECHARAGAMLINLKHPSRSA
jgi:hypothetical protein